MYHKYLFSKFIHDTYIKHTIWPPTYISIIVNQDITSPNNKTTRVIFKLFIKLYESATDSFIFNLIIYIPSIELEWTYILQLSKNHIMYLVLPGALVTYHVPTTGGKLTWWLRY